MKYAWIEEIVDGDEILMDGDEILDVGDVPFDPPQYEQVSQVPPVYEQVPTGNGEVTGLNRGAQEGERDGNCTPQDLVWGMDTELYKVSLETFTPFTVEEKAVVDAERQAEKDKEAQRAEAERVYAETCSAPVTIDGVTYKGGESSASGISGAVQLSQAASAETCFIADIYNIVREMSFEDALAVSGQIGMITYEAFIVRANTLAEIDSNDGE